MTQIESHGKLIFLKVYLLMKHSSLTRPEPVFTWDNLPKLIEHDIDDSAIFVFDLDHLPNYLRRASSLIKGGSFLTI